MSASLVQQPATGNSSFANRALTAVITLGVGTFGQTGKNTVTLGGLRAAATITKHGSPGMDAAEMRLYGVTPDVMNQVSTLGIPLPMVRHNNTLTIQAGDNINGMAPVFSGYLRNAWQDFTDLPETCLHLLAWSSVVAAVVPVAPVSFPGGADVATLMSGFAETMGLAFENSGVQAQLSSPYFAGTTLQQAQKCARAANIEMYIDTQANPPILAIWPKTGTRKGVVPLISAASGMFGYPTFMDFGMEFATVFNRNIRVGGQITMQSSVGSATTYANPALPTPQTVLSGGPNGLWYVAGPMTHDLTAQIPDGPWTTQCACSRVFAGAPVG